MKEIVTKDLNMGLLKKRTKAQLFQMFCHVANIANEYTPNGIGAIGDRALSKLNLVKDSFEIRYKDGPVHTETGRVSGGTPPEERPRVYVPPPYESVLTPWEPVPGEEVIINEGSTYWASGKKGTVVKKMDGGWEVEVYFADGFNGETTPRNHFICAYKVSQVFPKSQSPINEPATNPTPSNPS